ncbi:FtsX-like permease family protein [Photobacterium sp. GJ3]|uniref:ABC transporter permease n=1 Tax=Photobacterium sp. GJ3 TaxID=2829502 RepID=UPI001B8C749F|nr:FtsX-like permease family protein [Photobacterium sp. GJ3]QUJ66799.1 FtsX-like permease family protein [Photobacterium sp. GJ3]
MTEMSESQTPAKPKGHSLLLKWSWRELWQGQLWPVAVALTLIIACVFALASLVVRVEKIMIDQGRSMIAADLVLRSANPVPDSVLDSARALGMTTTEQTRFGTMAFSDQAMQLVSVKAVSSAFPLRGELVLKSSQQTQHEVKPGELWLSERLFALLAVKPGDPVAIGNAELTVAGTIVSEPELSFNPFSQMPGVLIHQSDLAATEAIQPGSRVRYRAYFNGDEAQLKQLQAQVSLTPDQRWISETSQGRTGDMIERVQQYLSLTLILVILMATATLVLTCMHYTASRTETVAMMKSLGARKGFLWRWLARQLGLLFTMAAVAGFSLGMLLEWLLRLPLTDVLPQPLPDTGAMPWLASLLVAVLVSVPGIGIALWRLLDAPALAVMQKQAMGATSNVRYLLILVPVAALLLWVGDNPLMWLTLAGLAGLLVVLAGLGLLIVRGLRRRNWGPAMTLALSRIGRSPLATGAQLAALTSSLMLLAVIWLLRTDLLQDWQQTLPPDAPNVFALNISPTQQQPYVDALDDSGLIRSDSYPIVRGRLVTINGVNPRAEGQASDAAGDDQQEGDESLRRELNFTWRDTLPVHNTLVAGEWRNTPGGVSVESEVAQRLGIKIGDTLGFNVNSQPFTATVTSLREVEWRNMRPNFYFIFTPDVMADLPATWLVSFRVAADQSEIVNQLGRDYPTVTLLDLRTMATRIQAILQQVSLSLSVLALLGVCSGLLLVLTLLRLSLSQRQQEIKLYRTLGASRRRIRSTIWSEYGLMAVLAGGIAVVGAEALVAALIKWGFELPVSLHPGLWLVLPVLSVLLILLIISSMMKQLLRPLGK